MQKRRQSGGSTAMALLILLLIAGAGAWNYQRNVAEEAKIYRPFRTHSDEDLTALSNALSAQNEQVSAQYESVAAKRATARDRSHYDQRLQEFERVQKAGSAKRAVQAELAMSNTTLKLLADEERMRAAEANPVKHFFTRLLTI